MGAEGWDGDQEAKEDGCLKHGATGLLLFRFLQIIEGFDFFSG